MKSAITNGALGNIIVADPMSLFSGNKPSSGNNPVPPPTPAVSKETDNANDFFNKNIQTQVVEGGANIDPSTGVYTPPAAYQTGRVLGITEQALPLAKGVWDVGSSLYDSALNHPWTADAKAATQAVSDAVSNSRTAIDTAYQTANNSVSAGIMNSKAAIVKDIMDVKNEILDVRSTIPGYQSTIDTVGKAVEDARGIANEYTQKLQDLYRGVTNGAEKAAADEVAAGYQSTIDEANGLIQEKTPILQKAQQELDLIQGRGSDLTKYMKDSRWF